MKRDGALTSLWQDTTPAPSPQSTAAAGGEFDVIIAGAGITGITTGLLLQKSGRKVLIAEAHTIGFGTTGGTTAHLNTFMDTPYYIMEKKFGESDTAVVADSIREALRLIRSNVAEYNIDCGLVERDAYLLSQDKKQSDELESIFKSSKKFNIDVAWDTPTVAIPYEKMLRFPGQFSFHPTRYLAGLARAFEEAGGTILENCRVTDVKEEEKQRVETSRGNFTSTHFIYATHIPPGVNLLHFRCAPYRSYAMAMELSDPSTFPNALVYDMYDPYHYYRTQEIDGTTYLIAGGEDHKTGHEENTTACLDRLEAHVRKYFSIRTITQRWSSQYFEPADGLPYIGHLPGHPDNMFVATGYGGNGMIYSAVAALTLTSLITTGKAKYAEVYDPNRIKMIAGFSNFVKEAADVTAHLVKSLFPARELKEFAELAPGEARLVKYEGHTVAAYKDDQGEIHLLNSACTHIKCDVAWNGAEKSWDCPCHGSRFSYIGEMLTGPARKDLERPA